MLPTTLTSLVAGSPLPLVQGFQKLQQLKVQLVTDHDVDPLGLLLSLTTPDAFTIVLDCGHPESDPSSSSIVLSKAAVRRAAALIGACSSLVSLEFDATSLLLTEDEADLPAEAWDGDFLLEVPLCAPLSQLTTLQRLVITGQHRKLPMQREDVMHLTALTGLTELSVVAGWQSDLDDVSAVALALSLTRLRRLQLACSSITSLAVVPVVARLTGLQSLYVSGGDECALSDRELPLLRTLEQLTSLTWGDARRCSRGAQAVLFEAIPGLSRIDAAVVEEEGLWCVFT